MKYDEPFYLENDGDGSVTQPFMKAYVNGEEIRLSSGWYFTYIVRLYDENPVAFGPFSSKEAAEEFYKNMGDNE